MDDKILEILLDIKKELKEVNSKVDKLDFKLHDGFETLEILSENSINELNKVKIKVSKLENRVKEINIIS